MDKVGRYAFLGGVIVAVLAGFISGNWIFPVLTILGLIVGLLNVTATEVQSFLLASVSLVIISALGADKIEGLPRSGGNARTDLHCPAGVCLTRRHRGRVEITPRHGKELSRQNQHLISERSAYVCCTGN